MSASGNAVTAVAFVACFLVISACKSEVVPALDGPRAASRNALNGDASAVPSALAPPPLAAELRQLKTALEAKDARKLEALLSPGGVECRDYLYGKAEFEVLVRRSDGRMRSWLFGEPGGGRTSVRTYLEATTPSISTQSPTHRAAEFVTSHGSLLIGFTLEDGRWLITEGLFCE